MAQRSSQSVTVLQDLRDASRGVRLHKAMAEAGVGSRRDCETLVMQGRVSVNGVPIPGPPIWVDPSRDTIEVDGRPIGRRPRRNYTYLLVHKTRDTICTNEDPHGRRRIFDLVPHTQRLLCVGRLDHESTGLVLLTDDGELVNQLTHPRYGIPKTYELSVSGQVPPPALERLSRTLGDEAGAVQVLTKDRERTGLRITLREGRNREIRQMLAKLGFRVQRLKRVGLGPLKLKGVAPGQWRELSREEIADVRHAAKRAEAHVARAGANNSTRRRPS